MSDRPFIVRNNRPRKTVTVCGQLLAPAIRGGRSELPLTEQEFTSAPVQRLIEMKRLVCVSTPSGWGEKPKKPTPKPKKAAAPKASPPPAPKAAKPKKEAAPALVPPDELPMEVAADKVDDSLLEDQSRSWSYDTLKPLTVKQIKKVAKSRGLKVGGKEDEVINRILDAQVES
jgi:hypothetical protein